MDIKKKWKTFYYRYNLTEPVETFFYTGLAAVIHGFWMSKRYCLRVHVSKIDEDGNW